jgi:CspA family cold shock protein
MPFLDGESEMHTGTVKRFDDQKGYGFIKLEGLSEDIFVHQMAIKMEGFRTLYSGEVVKFQIKKDQKGLKAVNVTRATDQVEVAPLA